MNFFMRWNVVIGGQLFSKSLRGLTTFKIGLMGMEGLVTSMLLLTAPFVLLYIFVKLLPPWKDAEATVVRSAAAGD